MYKKCSFNKMRTIEIEDNDTRQKFYPNCCNSFSQMTITSEFLEQIIKQLNKQVESQNVWNNFFQSTNCNLEDILQKFNSIFDELILLNKSHKVHNQIKTDNLKIDKHMKSIVLEKSLISKNEFDHSFWIWIHCFNQSIQPPEIVIHSLKSLINMKRLSENTLSQQNISKLFYSMYGKNIEFLFEISSLNNITDSQLCVDNSKIDIFSFGMCLLDIYQKALEYNRVSNKTFLETHFVPIIKQMVHPDVKQRGHVKKIKILWTKMLMKRDFEKAVKSLKDFSNVKRFNCSYIQKNPFNDGVKNR